MFRTLSSENSILLGQRKLFQRDGRRNQAIFKFATRRAGGLDIKNQISSYGNLVFFIWEDATLLSSLNQFLSCASQLSGAKSCFLFHLKEWQTWQMAVSVISWKSSAVTLGDGGIFWISFWSPYSHLEARNHWWLWHSLFIDLTGDIFISQVCIVKAMVFPVVMNRCKSWTHKVLKNWCFQIMV